MPYDLTDSEVITRTHDLIRAAESYLQTIQIRARVAGELEGESESRKWFLWHFHETQQFIAYLDSVNRRFRFEAGLLEFNYTLKTTDLRKAIIKLITDAGKDSRYLNQVLVRLRNEINEIQGDH